MYMYVCMYVCVCVCMCVCVRTRTHACMYVCVYVYVYVYAVCDSNYISPHFLSYVLYKRKYCEFRAGSI